MSSKNSQEEEWKITNSDLKIHSDLSQENSDDSNSEENEKQYLYQMSKLEDNVFGTNLLENSVEEQISKTRATEKLQ